MPYSRMYYLAGLSQEKLSALQKKYNKSTTELESDLSRYSTRFKVNLINHIVGNYGSNLLYLIFPIVTSAKGLTTGLRVFFKGIKVPSYIGYLVGGTISVFDVIAFACFYSVWDAAIKDTLDYIYSPSSFDNLRLVKRAFCETPKQAITHAVSSFFHLTVLGMHNLTGTMTELVFYLKSTTKPSIKWPATIITCYFGNEYYRGYTNGNYWEGIQFLSDKNRLPILSLDYPSSSFEMVLQYGSTVALRTYPLFYELAILSQDILGFWPHPYFVTACAGMHSLLVYLKSSYDPHLADREYLINQFLKDGSNKKIIEAICHEKNIPLSKEREIAQKLVSLQLDLFSKNLTKEEGRFYFLKNERMKLFYLFIRSLTGSFIGSSVISYCFKSSLLGYFLGIPLGGVLTSLSLYYSIKNNVTAKKYKERQKENIPLNTIAIDDEKTVTSERKKEDELEAKLDSSTLNLNKEETLLKTIAIDDEKNVVSEPQGKTHGIEQPPPSKGSHSFAVLLTFFSALATGMSTIGILSPDSSDMVKAIVTLLCIERCINSIYFNFPKILGTVREFSLFQCKKNEKKEAREEEIKMEASLPHSRRIAWG